LSGADYQPTDNRPVPYRCTSTHDHISASLAGQLIISNVQGKQTSTNNKTVLFL